jgi:hypothetical protein
MKNEQSGRGVILEASLFSKEGTQFGLQVYYDGKE